METAEEHAVSMTLETSLLPPTGDPEPHLLEFGGALKGWLDNDWTDIGKVRLFIANMEAAERHGLTAGDVFDAHPATACYLDLLDGYLYDGGGVSLSTATQRALADSIPDCGNVLLIDRIELLPRYRGRGYGLQAIELAIEHLGPGCRFAAMKLFPLQFEAGALQSNDGWRRAMVLQELTRDQEKATAALRRYYQRVGFRSVRSTDLMVRNLEMRWKRPLPAIRQPAKKKRGSKRGD